MVGGTENEKPEVTKSMFLTFVPASGKSELELTKEFLADNEGGLMMNYIIPLVDFSLTDDGKKTVFELPEVPKELHAPQFLNGKYDRCAIALTDDPRVEHALDWGDLGCFRLTYKMAFPQLKKKGKGLQIIIKSRPGFSRWNRDITVPDRRRWFA
jgi:hypothetical protein